MARDDDKKVYVEANTSKSSRNRDDTPSFIRNVETRAAQLNPASTRTLPLLTMPITIKRWRQVRWPLFIFLIIALLTTVGLITNDRLIARRVERAVAKAQKIEGFGTVEHLALSSRSLIDLMDRHDGRSNVQIAFAWQTILDTVLLGEKTGDRLELAREAIEDASEEVNGVAWAARAGLAYLDGDFEKALTLTEQGLEQHAGDPRVSLVRMWTLLANGNYKALGEAHRQVLESTNPYIPLIVVGVATALKIDARQTALNLTDKLLTVSPDHLYGALATIALALPRWGQDNPKAEKVASMLTDIDALKPRISTAPPNFARLGHYLFGRVSLLSGQIKRAVEFLASAVTPDMEPEVLAWYAHAYGKLKGPQAAIALLEQHQQIVGPPVFDVHAHSLIWSHRITAATAVTKKLANTGALGERVRELRWLLAIRSGDVAGALRYMPSPILPRQQFYALELYHLAAAAGHTEAVGKVIDGMKPRLGACALALRQWHDPDERRASSYLKTDDGNKPCVDALSARLLLHQIDPALLKTAVDRAARASNHSLSIEIDRALVTQLTAGKQPAVKILDQVLMHNPDGVPLLARLGRALIALNQAERALEVLNNREEPELLAVRILAARALHNKRLEEQWIQQAIAKNDATPHPALTFFAMERQLEGSRFHNVVAVVEARLPTAGAWTAELAELAAKAYNSLGERRSADQLLLSTARTARSTMGWGESWEASRGVIRLNLRRGGNFMYKALAVLNALFAAGVKHAELSYSLAVIHMRQGNERGALRFLREAVGLDPSFTRIYRQLAALDRLDDELIAVMQRTVPEYKPPSRTL